MPKFIQYIFIALASNGFSISVTAQTFPSDSLFLQKSVDSAIALQKRTLGENLRLYNGPAYSLSYSGTKGHPYFLADSLQPATILYDGGIYHNIPLLFDLISDDVVISSFHHDQLLTLVKDKVDGFLLAGHSFERLDNDSSHGAYVSPGFYEILYKDSTAVYARHEKKLKELARVEGIDARFIDFHYYFLRRDNLYYSIDNESSLVNAFGNRKKDVKTYLHKNHIKFKKDPISAMVHAAAYYDQVKK